MMQWQPTTGIINAPDGDAGELPQDARAAKVSYGTDPQHPDGRQPYLHRAERRAKQLRTVTHGGDGNRHAGRDQQRHPVGIVGHKGSTCRRRIRRSPPSRLTYG